MAKVKSEDKSEEKEKPIVPNPPFCHFTFSIFLLTSLFTPQSAPRPFP